MGPQELALADALDLAYRDVGRLMTVERDYDAALAALAGLRGVVDDFFESVLVMDEDERLRTNRLAMLNRLGGLFAGFADFGRLTG